MIASFVLSIGLSLQTTPRTVAYAATTITVNTIVDYPLTGNPATDCATLCSLRAALEKNDCLGGGNIVSVPNAGDYKLSPFTGSISSHSGGPIVIARSVTLTGASARTVLVDGQNQTADFIIDWTGISNCGVTATTTGSFNPPPSVDVLMDHVAVENGNGGASSCLSSARPLTSVVLCIGAGGILAEDNGSKTTLTLDHVAVSNNSSFRAGGLSLLNTSTTLRSVTLSGNSGDRAGIDASGDLSLLNVTMSGNQGTTAGALFAYQGSTSTIEWTTISGNSGTAAGGIDAAAGSTIKVGQSILSKNGANCNGTVTSVGNNIADDSTCVFAATGDAQNTDPKLGPLANNGGEVDTMGLLPTSPAIDKVVPTNCNANQGLGGTASPLTVDARDLPRPSGSGCDVGAYELQQSVSTSTSEEGDTTSSSTSSTTSSTSSTESTTNGTSSTSSASSSSATTSGSSSSTSSPATVTTTNASLSSSSSASETTTFTATVAPDSSSTAGAGFVAADSGLGLASTGSGMTGLLAIGLILILGGIGLRRVRRPASGR